MTHSMHHLIRWKGLGWRLAASPASAAGASPVMTSFQSSLGYPFSFESAAQYLCPAHAWPPACISMPWSSFQGPLLCGSDGRESGAESLVQIEILHTDASHSVLPGRKKLPVTHRLIQWCNWAASNRLPEYAIREP